MSLRAVFPVFDGVGLALNGVGKGLRSERSLHGEEKRRTGRVIGSGQGVAGSSFGVWGAVLLGRRRVGGGGCPRRLIRSPERLGDLPSLFPDRRDEIDPGIDAGPAQDLIDAVLIALGDLEMPGSVVDPVDANMRQVLEHLPRCGLGHHPSGRPVKGLLGLPHLIG
ncbi:MAG: hypothetical protein M0041_04500 [Nitrospiraceae bacterium]|nr:hypothetical protein [Nitrospiraceae bacterium]